jgi:hypothetical protein
MQVVVSPCPAGATIRIAGSNKVWERMVLSAPHTTSMFMKYAVNPARLVSSQAFSLVANGNVVSGAATSMLQLQPGSFAIETRRPSVYAAFRQMLFQQLITP